MLVQSFQTRARGALAECFLLWIALGWNAFLYRWESRLTLLEMEQRLEMILDRIKTHGMNYRQVRLWEAFMR